MELPLSTADLPGTGGRIKDRIDDFVVVELPLYEPAGVGDHTYLLVEKRGITTHDAARRIARTLGAHPNSVGYAGRKDARAVTVQTFSVEHVAPDAARKALEPIEGLRVLEASLHRNKLRVGHLRGNRFEITVRGVVPDAAGRARAILKVLARSGAPNWFAEQRFGARGDNHEVGRLLVAGDPAGAVDRLLGGLTDRADGTDDDRLGPAQAAYAAGDLRAAADALPPAFRSERRMLRDLARGRPPEKAIRAFPRATLRLLVCAYQSHLFNEVLRSRLDDLGQLEAGDLAFLHDRGAVFAVEDPAAEQPRADSLEISPTGPLFGTKMIRPTGEPGKREAVVLAAEGREPSDFVVSGVGTFPGARRPLRIPVSDIEVDDGQADVIRVKFALPKGSYATVVMREIVRSRA